MGKTTRKYNVYESQGIKFKFPIAGFYNMYNSGCLAYLNPISPAIPQTSVRLTNL